MLSDRVRVPIPLNMATKKKTQICPNIEPKKLHHDLGRVLVKELRDNDLFARNSEQKHNRLLPPSQLLPLLP